MKTAGKNHGNKEKKWIKTALTGIGLAVLLAAVSVPFIFESQSLYYKFGIEKQLLQAGKVCGLAAALLILLQAIVMSKPRVLEQAFSVKKMFAFHRMNGMLICLLVLLHPFLILAAEGFVFYPFEKRYWAEFVGVGLVILIAGIILLAPGRKIFNLRHQTRRRIHQLITPLVVIPVWLHIGFVSESFGSGPPLIGLFILGGSAVIALAVIYHKRFTRH